MLYEMSSELQAMPVGLLEQNIAVARAALDVRLQTPAEQEILRTIQIDATKAIADALGRGKSAFHIDEATGMGKTAIGLQIADTIMPVLRKDGHGRAVFVAPTLDIVNQTAAAAAIFAPNLKVSTYASRGGENLDGDLIVTTYQSLGIVVNRLRDERAQDVRLLIADEFHKGQGEQRSAVYPEMRNAIMLGLSATPDDRTIQAMVDAGKVDADARWISMFRDKVHEVDLSEAVGEFLAPLDVRIIETELDARDVLDASDVTVEGDGKYNPEQINRFASTELRTLMGVAFLKGSRVLTDRGIRLIPQQIRDIDAAHQEVKGRNVLIFGQTIEHTKDIIALLRQEGIKAEPYHNEVSPPERTRLRERGFGDETYNVLVGVKGALGEGVDLPEADVAIFLDVTRDPIGLEQKLGRILRPAPGKTALAIQLRDRFQLGRKPVLIPQLFTKEALQLNQRRALGTVRRRRANGEEVMERPRIIFSGVDIETFFQQVEFERILASEITQATSIEALHDNLETIIHGVSEDLGMTSAMTFYRTLADILPQYIPAKINKMAFDAAMEGDTRGAHALLFLNMKTILSVVNKYSDIAEEDDLVQEAIMKFMEKYKNLKSNIPVAQAIYQVAESGVVQYLADRESMGVSWVRSGWYMKIRNLADRFIAQHPPGVFAPKHEFAALVRREVPEFTGNDTALEEYILIRDIMQRWEEELLRERVNKKTINRELFESVFEDENILTPRERLILYLRFGILDGESRTFETIGRELHVTGARIREIEERALRKLRHPDVSRRLKEAR